MVSYCVNCEGDKVIEALKKTQRRGHRCSASTKLPKNKWAEQYFKQHFKQRTFFTADAAG
ncbi:hypothetical protein RMSM_04427 [Rhodopirellula maiorica SM1]|uniref:Uncharacterized protein n=1 Tax=Rhodopirellula maiorica SM1 TaxID=1265738 RepID=M5RHI5_9BACT|nr:hypothetical protein RMSM_04427 [Rhodopirellula maiorica SM1]